MLGGNALGIEQYRLDRSKDILAGLVQRFQSLTQLLTKTIQPVANDLVSIAVQHDFFAGLSILLNLCLGHDWISHPERKLRKATGPGMVSRETIFPGTYPKLNELTRP